MIDETLGRSSALIMACRKRRTTISAPGPAAFNASARRTSCGAASRLVSARPDAVLANYGFGRAHHRVVHFVNRHPGMRVADLLDILKITKQSLGRVLKQLVDNGFIEQLPGPQDRRQRLLYPTEAGRALALRLLDPQMRRIGAALAALSPTERAGAEKFLRQIVDESERDKVARLIGR